MRIKLLSANVALIASILGCASNTGTEPRTDAAVGTYVLVSANGQSLPATVAAGVVVLDGSLFIANDETYTSGVQMQVLRSGVPVIEKRGIPDGKWSRVNATRIWLYPTSTADNTYADFTGTNVTLGWAGVGFQYKKR